MNLFSRFSDIAGQRRVRTVGVCVSLDAEGCTLQYAGGSLVRVHGEGVVGRRYFVVDGRLDGEAPGLPTLVIEV